MLKMKDHAIDILKETILEITDFEDKIKCIFVPHLNVRELEWVNIALWKEYLKFEKTLEDEAKIYIDKSGDALKYLDVVDMYYGDGDEVAHRCRNIGVPVMIRKA